MYHMQDPFMMLVGRHVGGRVGQVAPMLPGGPLTIPQAVAPPGPWGYAPPPSGCGGGAPAACWPMDYCPPQSAGFYAQAARAAVAANTPQTGLGINSRDQAPNTAIGAGLSRTLSVSPSVPFCATTLRVSRTSSPFFSIMSMKAARVEYLSDGQGLPADDFAPDSELPPIQMPQLYPGTSVTIIARNNDTADHHFDAAFYGIPGPSCSPCL